MRGARGLSGGVITIPSILGSASLSCSFLPPFSSPQTERKFKWDVQKEPQKTLEKQNFTLSFAAFSLLLMFNFSSPLLSFIYSSFFFLFYYFLRLLVHTAALQPSLCTHPSPQVAADSTHSHPHCWKGRHKSCPTAGDLHPRTGGIQEGDEEQAPGKKRAQTTSTTWETAAHPLPEQVLKPTHKCIARRNQRYLSKTVFLPQILPSSFCPFLDECQGDRKAQNEPKQSYSDSSASSVSGESSN